jgi:hypothetical protein
MLEYMDSGAPKVNPLSYQSHRLDHCNKVAGEFQERSSYLSGLQSSLSRNIHDENAIKTAMEAVAVAKAAAVVKVEAEAAAKVAAEEEAAKVKAGEEAAPRL